MTDDRRDDSDPWLTLAEIADELRVNPATVRQWVSKKQLKASRAGVRKWIVRRSDLDRMLAESNLTPDEILEQFEADASTRRPDPPSRRPSPEPREAREVKQKARPKPATPKSRHAVELLRLAIRNYEDAMAESKFAPPSPGYIDRVRLVADACEHVAGTMINAAETAGTTWTPQASFADHLPYELKPGGNRPGPAELWEEFDATFDRLVITATAPDALALGQGFRELADALNRVADELDQDEEWQAWERQAR